MKIRIISAIIALAIIIPFIYLGNYYFAGLMGIFAVLGYKEVIDLKKKEKNIPKIPTILGLLSLIYFILIDNKVNSLYMSINHSRLILPLLLLLLPTVFYKDDKYNTSDAFYLIGFIYLLGLLFSSFILIRNIDLNILIYLICVTILTDTYAYIVGLLIGKHKLIESISPNKTIEGSIGGLVGGVTISLIVYANLIGEINIKIIIMTILLSVLGQLGDLIYSKIKRENKIKDFSNIMPGHGGILDRVDSLTFVILGYILIINII